MPAFTGQLKTNEIFAALYNMIISQQVFAKNIAGGYTELVDMARVDGGLYGDTKLYTATDILDSYEWGNDAEAANLLKLHRPPAPKTQAITIDKFRVIPVTVDNYMTKRAWGTEGAFAQFNGVIKGWLVETKKVFEASYYNTFIGTTLASGATGEALQIDVTSAVGATTGEEAARIKGATIAQAIADLIVNLKDATRDYNDNGFMRAYDIDDLVFVWNADIVNEIEKRDLPTTYHKDIVEKLGQYVLPGRYFGSVSTSAETVGDGKTYRFAVPYTNPTNGKQYLPGDLVPNGLTVTSGVAYKVNTTIAFKVFHKDSVPLMSAFEVGTSFFNPRSLTETNYLIWGYNTLEYLKNYPFITAVIK